MPYCEITRSQCLRFPEFDIGHCHDCSESEIAVREEIANRGIQLTDVDVVRYAPLSSICATDLSTEQTIVQVKNGKISYGTRR